MIENIYQKGCVYLAGHRKKVEHGLLHGGFKLGTSRLAHSATTVPAELTPVIRYCPVLKTVA